MLLFRPWYQQSLPGRWVEYWDLYCRKIHESFTRLFFFFPFLSNKAFESPLGTPNVQLLLKQALQSQSCTASLAIYGFDHSGGLLLQAITLPSPLLKVIFLGSSESSSKCLVKQHFCGQKTSSQIQLGWLWRCFERQKPFCHLHSREDPSLPWAVAAGTPNMPNRKGCRTKMDRRCGYCKKGMGGVILWGF